MQAGTSPVPENHQHKSIITGNDLLGQHFKDSLYQILPFEKFAIYFPRDHFPKEVEWIPDEKRLLVPLRYNGEFIGSFVARFTDPEPVQRLLPTIPAIANLCLENLALYKTSRIDHLTGLCTSEVLRERLQQEAELIQSAFLHGPEDAEDERPHAGNMGLIAAYCCGLHKIEKENGYAFAERMIVSLASAFTSVLPEQALAARAGAMTLAAFLPGATSAQCEETGREMLAAMNQVRLTDPLTGRRTGMQIFAGYALYPQDMDGTRLREMSEHAPVLLQKAGLAAEIAHARALSHSSSGATIMGYGKILHEGGEIKKMLPLSRVIISIGYQVGVREGQHFSVWSDNTQNSSRDMQPLYKGEIAILDVRESEAVAEIVNIGDPAWSLEIGDMLALLPDEEEEESMEKNVQGQNLSARKPDLQTGLLRHGDFLAKLAEARTGCTRFALALVHVAINPVPADAEEQHALPYADRPDHLMASLADLCRRTFTRQNRRKINGFTEKAFGGRFGLNSLIFFHPDAEEDSLRACYEILCDDATHRLGRRVAAGLAVWPYLHFRPGDMLECLLKALEYALLLPPPHVGVFDSLALNISADKKHCMGDVFGAIEEYKLALLADEKNALAWNSLGVCMASLGRKAEARRHFEKAMQLAPDDPAPAYNLGAICQNLGEMETAAGYFHDCLKLNPTHLYAKVRLGQIAEATGKLDEASACFLDAVDMDEQESLPYRNLARLALHQNCPDTAREYLHQALLRNPRDAAALSLMAQLYLDGGEDPDLATALARQSVNQRPDRKSAWLVLARALETQGRHAEAQEARLQAGEL